MTDKKYSGHVVICNWNQRGFRLLELLRAEDVHKKQRDRDIVIISKETFSEEDQGYRDFRVFPMNPWEETGLGKAGIERADSIIILSANGREDPDESDGAVIRTALAVKNYLANTKDKQIQVGKPSIVAELNRKKNREYVENLGIDEIVVSRDIGMRLLAQTVICPGVTTFFNDILEVSKETNEVYAMELPKDLINKDADFNRVWKHFYGKEMVNRPDNPILPIGMKLRKRAKGVPEDNGEFIVLVNPQNQELKDLGIEKFFQGDQVLVLANESPA